jgi:radical SAM superfamily enzyme YgiQ (UPF0313 family)
MKIMLIRPNIGTFEDCIFVDRARMEPLALGVIAALTPPEHEVVMYDEHCEEVPLQEQADLVAMTVETFTARRAYELADLFREKGVPVVLGGIHPTLLPDEASCHADAVVVGDAEETWPILLKDAAKKQLKPRYYSAWGLPQVGIPARRDIFRGKKYLPLTLLQYGRGCRYSCEFCSVGSYFRGHYAHRETGDVIDEIRNQKRKTIFFVDDNIVTNRTALKDLLRRLVPLKIRWVSQAGLDMLEDDELMKLMKESGCMGHLIGFESIEPKNIRLMSKSANVSGVGDVYRNKVEMLRDYGLQTWAAFTIGYDFDTPESIKETLEFAVRSKFTFADFNILIPFPGTRLYDRMTAEGRLLFNGEWWIHPEYRFNQAVFKPKNLGLDELTDLVFRCRCEFNSLKSIAYRFFEPKTNMGSLPQAALYLGYTPLFRKEILKKQGMRLGMSG